MCPFEAHAPARPVTPGKAASADKKKKKKKKKKDKKGEENQDSNTWGQEPSDDDDDEDDGPRKPEKDSAEAAAADPVQLPLGQRLEVAASHQDVHAALVGLVGWSRLYAKTDTILAFFQCNALEMLLENLLRSRGVTDAVYDNLNALLLNCLQVERSGKPSSSSREIAATVVATVRGLIGKIRSAREEVVDLGKVAQHLSKLVLTYRLSLTGVGVGSSLSKDVMRIESELPSAAKRDGKTQGQAIRDSFLRRDIRSDALTLYSERLKKMHLLVQESTPSAAKEPTSSSNLACSFAPDGDSAVEIDESQLEEIKKHVSEMNEEKATAIAPLQQKKSESLAKMAALKEEREALEARLKAINGEIQHALTEQRSIDDEIEGIEKEFSEKSSQFDNDHQHIIEYCQRKGKREEIAAEVLLFEESVRKISLAHSEVQTLKDKMVTCLRQHLEGMLRYFASELPCVKFMKNRVEETQNKMKSLMVEAETYKVLGVGAVAKEIVANTNELQSLLEEDMQCLKTLSKRDEEVLQMLNTLLTSPATTEILTAVNEQLINEVRRHADFLENLHRREPSQDPPAPVTTSNTNNGAIGSQIKS
ncbi:TPA: hypothetical protein N0F65_002329 [Lagenidium giganteum]|uniref:Uncharacterized protein n=1 Tax=Lagenidium giganteum TaxID=4803 RepID=A0AAV2Z550_9STRA|nr:TPA: hypothetical protein N0F65_002329 [Lagenidium giganteum]